MKHYTSLKQQTATGGKLFTLPVPAGGMRKVSMRTYDYYAHLHEEDEEIQHSQQNDYSSDLKV